MTEPSAYRLVRLLNGVASVHSLADAETMHPVIGPAAEAELLYVRQLRLAERMAAHDGEFVVWDIGLGAAANALAIVRAAPELRRTVRLVSFDHTLELLRFAMQHASDLEYLVGFAKPLGELIERGATEFQESELRVNWTVHVGDFPTFLAGSRRGNKAGGIAANPPPHVGGYEGMVLPAPHAILFDPFSPAKNPAMWTAPLFADLFRLLDPKRPCSLATYTRSTMIRVALLLAGFFVGAGHATGEKEETTIAANTLDLLDEPLEVRWLERARRSDSAEPLWEPVHRRAKLSEATWERLRAHPQFS